MNPSEPAAVADAAPSPRLSYAFARRNGVLLETGRDGSPVAVLRADAPPGALLELQRACGAPAAVETVSAEEFGRRLTRQYERGSGGALDAVDELGGDSDLARAAEALPEPEDLMESEDDAPIIRLINAILTEAVRHNASDVHIEPFEQRLAVRMRIDGVMQETVEPPRSIAPLIISRIKVMARLDISEKRLPQDGRISLRIAGRPVDVRVSTLPSGHGERVVLRLLDKQAGRLDLEHLGMSARDVALMGELIHRPHGILLVTGPTGSGKTTTLYAALTRLNDASRSILTVEDPIEYYLDGIGQTQVNTRVELTFARGLRAILRQDPDVVMVGEIRDLETAQIAVQASLTGHLVLSTLHTNTAIGAITRLRDMGVEPFLLSSSVVGILAQRLVRLLCTHCRVEHSMTAAECALFELDADDAPRVYAAGPGCEHCNRTGFVGRSGIYELVALDRTLRSLVHDGAGEFELERHARRHGPGIRADGLRRILAGETSIEEVLRVTPGGDDEAATVIE
ncbi:MAG: type II secretion system ATPase GspE [Halofilum sp. (in: g-proteobacteria)]|nr:type II secretion system ATPase GspE [Halofilum sp. (in: g-proteobacteria)]